MIVLKANELQYEALNGFQKNNSRLEFVKDDQANWIVGKGVLHDSNFEEINNDLLALIEIPYSPVSQEE